MKKLAWLGAIAVVLPTLGCSVDEVPDGLKRTPDGEASTVKWDLYHKPLPDIPIPNDAAMWPDPSSRTGLRVNASDIAPTNIETTARKKFDQLEGWGTFAPITVGFKKMKADDPRPAIDVANVAKRHQGDDYELANDAIYVVNLDTGIPALMDLGEGSFQYAIRDKQRYWRNDTRRWEQNLMFETADETIDPLTGKQRAESVSGGVPLYKPEWDTDFDGVLDRPNLLDPSACPNQVDLALGNVKDAERDRCITDKLLTFYERETDTLIMRPLVPLQEKTQYAVVITDRLLDADGKPVKSPFEFVYHPAQEQGIERLQAHLSSANLQSYYGDIGGTGLKHVAFAWTFTTQPVTEDLVVIRDGLYGKGPLAKLATDFPGKTEMQQAAGLVDLESKAEGAEDPPGWEQDSKCVDKVGQPYIVKFSTVKETLKELAKQGFDFSGPTLETLIESFNSIDYIAIGSFKTPFFITGGPQGQDPNASFDMDFRTGEGTIYTDTVQYLLVVPKETTEHKQPFPVAYYGHGYTSSSLEVMGFGGHLAAQGIASVGMNATFHGLELGETELALARGLFKTACEAPFASALLSGRARDLDGDGTKDSGGDYWTAYLFHTRDVVRQSAVDLLQMFRVFKSFDGKKMSDQDYDADGKPNLAGDFDGNGVPDVGGPNSEFYAWGQSLGGILAPFVAALDPNVIAAAPTSGAGGLLDVGARTTQGGAFEGIYLRAFGPMLVGLPAKEEFYDTGKEKETSCTESQISLRFVVIDVNTTREVEFQCVDRNEFAKDGGTAFVVNAHNGEQRCARVDKDGRFRIGIPSSAGDQLEVQLWDVPDAVDSYDGKTGCNFQVDKSHRIELIQKWGEGIIPNGGKDPVTGDVVCHASGGCSKFQSHYFAAGSKLVAPTEGFGYIRQTPSLRRLLNLASSIVDPGDPINYAPYMALKPLSDPFGKPHPPTAFLNVVSIGDNNVPINSGMALGRAAGAIPFLAPDAAERYPAYADYVTPAALYADLGQKTPNRVLIDEYVMEGINRLERHPPADPANACHPNEVPLTVDDVVCHPTCTDTDASACLSDQSCINGRCVIPPISASDCVQYLYDADVLDQGMGLYGEDHASPALRLARIAMPATPDDIDAIWEPRLTGKPGVPDQAGWKANARILGELAVYVNPKGNHGFEPANPCQNWDSGQYMINLLGRLFASSGADLYYLSHPTSHECLARPIGKGSCPFVIVP